MADGIIVVILVVAMFLGIRSTVKHFAGKSGCCGSSDYKPKKKKLSRVLFQKVFQVEGMHCEHCKRRVEEAVNDIHGIAGSVNLKKGELTVSYEQDVEDAVIMEQLQKRGYSVVYGAEKRKKGVKV